MKAIIKSFAVGLLMLAISPIYAQEINGQLVLDNQSRAELKGNFESVVDLYAHFRQQNSKIHFKFEGSNLPKTSSGNTVAAVKFVTTVKRDGKVVGKLERQPIPFFPGDMWMPVETFDFVPILFGMDNGNLPKGRYEVQIDVVPVGVKGKVTSLIIFF